MKLIVHSTPHINHLMAVNPEYVRNLVKAKLNIETDTPVFLYPLEGSITAPTIANAAALNAFSYANLTQAQRRDGIHVNPTIMSMSMPNNPWPYQLLQSEQYSMNSVYVDIGYDEILDGYDDPRDIPENLQRMTKKTFEEEEDGFRSFMSSVHIRKPEKARLH